VPENMYLARVATLAFSLNAQRLGTTSLCDLSPAPPLRNR